MSQTDVQQIHIRAYLYRTDIETNTHFLLVVHIKKIRQIEWIFESGACTSQTAIATQPKSRAATKGGKIIVNTIEKLEKHGAHIHTVSNSTENYDIHSFRIIFIVLFVAIKGVFFPFFRCCFVFCFDRSHYPRLLSFSFAHNGCSRSIVALGAISLL